MRLSGIGTHARSRCPRGCLSSRGTQFICTGFLIHASFRKNMVGLTNRRTSAIMYTDGANHSIVRRKGATADIFRISG
jgi:hypothetical protein